VIVSIVAAALGGLIALDFGAPPELSVSAGIAAFILVMVLLGVWGFRAITAFWKDLAPKFPQPR
jgi:purine-cytosine permease-like protein